MPDHACPDMSDESMPHAARIAESDARERIRFQARFVEHALWSLIAVNGLWEIGSVALPLSRFVAPAIRMTMWHASLVFAIGIVLALATYATSFLSQGFYYGKSLHEIYEALGTHSLFGGEPNSTVARFVRHGRIAEIAALSTALMSLGALAVGSAVALSCLRPG